jgi:hypothetical protein
MHVIVVCSVRVHATVKQTIPQSSFFFEFVGDVDIGEEMMHGSCMEVSLWYEDGREGVLSHWRAVVGVHGRLQWREEWASLFEWVCVKDVCLILTGFSTVYEWLSYTSTRDMIWKGETCCIDVWSAGYEWIRRTSTNSLEATKIGGQFAGMLLCWFWHCIYIVTCILQLLYWWKHCMLAHWHEINFQMQFAFVFIIYYHWWIGLVMAVAVHVTCCYLQNINRWANRRH